jgi:hypothetical protein
MSYTSKDVMYNANLKEVFNDIIEQLNNNGGAYILGSPALSIGSSSAAKVKNAAFAVVRDGVISTIASTETAFTATTHDIADGYEAIFNVYLDEDNTITLLKGTEVATAVPAVSVCPDTPSGGLKIGEVKVATDGAAFDASTTLLSAGTVTDTYTDKTDNAIDFSDYEDKHWLYHDNLEDVIEDFVNIVANDGVEILTSTPTLAIGSSDASKIKHGDITTLKDGVIKKVAGGEVAFTATTHDITANGSKAQEAVYLVYLDDSTVKISKGDTADDGEGVCPDTPAGKLKLGEVKISVETGSTDFDATTDDLSEAHLTDTYTDATDSLSVADIDVSSYGLADYNYSESFYDLLDDLEEDLNTVKDDRLLENPTLVIGSSSAAKVKNSAFGILQDGSITTISSTETAFTATTHDITASASAIQEAIYLVYLDGSTIKLSKGTTAAEDAAVCPDTPSGKFKLGEVKVQVAKGSTDFNATTDDLDAAHLTTTFTSKLDVFDEIA